MYYRGPFYFLFALLWYLLPGTCVLAQSSVWEPLAPGAGGQVQDLYFDPYTEGKIWLSSDVDGTYLSTDYGERWNFVSRDLSHGMSFKIRRNNTPGGRIFQGGLQGAHYSDNEGRSWTLIGETDADAIATIAIGADDQTVVLAPSWHTKDPQKQQAAIIDPLQPLTGPRSVYVSADGGDSFSEVTYEATEGYRQVFGAYVHPTTGIIYLGAAAGVYRSTDATGSSWVRVENPAGAHNGPRGGVVTTEVRNPNGSIDLNGYRYSGGCTGMAITPDGSRVFAVFQTAERGWTMYTTTTAALATNDPQWQAISELGDDPLPAGVQWFNPRIDPRSDADSIKLVIGSTFLVNDNRVGLFEGNIRLDAGGEVTAADWDQVLFNRGNLPWSFAQGWETVSLISRAYDYTPASWSSRRIISGGGNTFFLSTDPAAAGWPFNDDSWLPIYTRRNPDTSPGPIETYDNRGFVNTVTYDIAGYGDYMIQGNADQGILESWNFGRSWTKESFAFKASNAQSVEITYTDPPIVIADARTNSFGIPQFDRLSLMARELTDPGSQVPASDWRQIGGNDGPKLVNGMVNRIVQGMALDECHPSRVYLGVRQLFGVGGIWATEEIEGVYAGVANWREISSPGMRSVFTWNDLFVDPNDPNVLWASGGTLWRGTRSGPYEWSWENSGIRVADMHVWDNKGKTVVAVAASLDDGPQEIYFLKNPRGQDLTRFVSAGLTVARTLQLRPEVWLTPGNEVDFEGMAGYGDQIFVTTVVSRNKKGLGVFKGTIKENGQVGWEPWSTDISGFDFFYPRDGTADAKILKTQRGDLYYAIPTFGAGVWRRYFGTDDKRASLVLSGSGLSFSREAGDVKTLRVTSEGQWNIRRSDLPDWIEASPLRGRGATTITFRTIRDNDGPASRTEEVLLRLADKRSVITLTQTGRPADIRFVPDGIQVDGTPEAAWAAVRANPITYPSVSGLQPPADSFRLAYTRDRLYVQGTILDGQNFPGDGIILALDVDNSKTLNLTDDDFVIELRRDGTVGGVASEAAVTEISGGYAFELAINWSDLGTFPSAGATLGLEVRANRQVDAAGRLLVGQYFGTDELTSPLKWGEGTLTGTELPWFEPFDLPEFTQLDEGPTAWSLDLTATDLDGDDSKYFHVERETLKGRHLDGEGVWMSEEIDISVTDFVRLRLDVQEKGSNGAFGGYLRVFVSIDGGEEIRIGAIEGDSPDDGEFREIAADGLSGSTLRVIVRINNTNGGTNHVIDNVLVDFGSFQPCPEPTALTVDGVRDVAATLSWSDPGTGQPRFDLRYRPAGATDYVTVDATDELSSELVGLTPSTTYEWQLRRRCPTELSDWTDGPEFITEAPIVYEDVYFETFDEAGCTPAATDVNDYDCYAEPAATYAGTAVTSDLRNDGSYPDASNGFHVFLQGSGETLRATGINSAAYDRLRFSFAVLKNSRPEDGSSLNVEILDGGTVVTTIPVSLPQADTSNQTWYVIVSEPELVLPRTSDFGYRITATANTRYRIDDIRLEGEFDETLSCAPVSGLTVSGLSPDAATVSWTGSADETAGYEVQLALRSDGTFGTPQTTTGEILTFTGLVEESVYDYRVRTRCAASVVSDWATGSFTTTSAVRPTIFREEHDRDGCTNGGTDPDTYGCYSFLAGDHAGNGVMSDQVASAGYPNASGGNHVFLNDPAVFYSITGIEATGFTDLQLAFGVRKNRAPEDGSTFLVEVTNDGGANWTAIPITYETGTGTNAIWYQFEEPVSLSPTNDMGVRFTATGVTRYRLDDVELSGIQGNSRSLLLRPAATPDFLLYPNPTTTELRLSVPPLTRVTSLDILDLTGRGVFHREVGEAAGAGLSLDVRQLPPGVYLLRIASPGGHHILKFTKQ